MSPRVVWALFCAAMLGFPGAVRGQADTTTARFLLGLSAGMGLPSGEVEEVLGPGFAWEISTGYRLLSFLRLDGAVGMVMAGSGDTYSIETTGGTRSVSVPGEILVRVGPSLLIPAGERVLLTLGGGYAWGRYEEEAEKSANEIIVGFGGEGRSGTGMYGTVSVERILAGRSQGKRGGGLGASLGYYRLDTDGDSLHGLFSGPTRDQWITVSLILNVHL